MKLVSPRVTRDQLMKQCQAIGLERGDLVMVHSGLKTIGEILGGPDVLIDSIINAIGDGGTMMMYVGCQSPYDDIGREVYSAEDEAFIQQHCPPFDYRTARASRDYSALAELFRTRVGTVCSENVGGRMAALGEMAHWLTREHGQDYGLGCGSPLEKLYESNGKVLLVGSDLDAVTLLHYAEAIAPIENKRLFHLRVPINDHGRCKWIDVVEFDSSEGICDWPERFFGIILEKYITTNQAREGKIGNATSYLINAKSLVDFAIPIMVETAALTSG